MSFISLLIFVLLLVAGSIAKDWNATISCFSVERNALLKFKASFSDPSRKLSSWNSENMDCCKWKGVQCDEFTGHVIVIDLRHYYHSYSIRLTSEELDPSIMELKHLSHLDLSRNDFQSSSVPASIGTLNQLQYLNLSYANFSGVVPQQLGNLSRLSVLDLGHNGDQSLIVDDFTWMSHLSLLTHLDMSDANLTSTKDLLKVLNMLPSIVSLSLRGCGLENENLQHLCAINSANFLPNIRYLDLSKNRLGGDFPCFLENMTSLTHLDLFRNSFEWTSYKTFKFIQNNCNLESLELGYNSLSGDISNIFLNSSKCLGRKLTKLGLSNNNFYGKLPEEVGGFKRLEHLDLSGNNISGTIPTSISNLSALTELYLGRNKLNGSIPSSLGNLTSLRKLYLDNNQLSGEIPTSISNLSALTELYLGRNKLNGSIPSSLGNLTSLRFLYLSDNQLSGEIPTSLGQLQNLELLSISRNHFHGLISESHLANLSKLTELVIGNDLTRLRVGSDWTPPFQLTELSTDSCEIEGGQFPKWLQTQKELILLSMVNCGISEAIPDWFRYRNLSELYLSENRIEGSIPESLCEMNYVDTLSLSGNRLLGNIPECLANLSSLGYLDLSLNRFSGVIPNSIGGAYLLRLLKLNGNYITGEFPSSLRNCTQLEFLDIGQNKISGRLPKWIGKYFPSMEYLRLSENDFYGTIPLELCRLSMLKILELDNNKLTGNIPGCFGNFSYMVNNPDPSNSGSNFEFGMQVVTKGSKMEYIEMLRYVRFMDLSHNDLVGEIPLELTRLVSLRSLNLSHNHLQGMISGKIGEMKLLESLDLSYNNLFGSIPASLSDLDSLGFLNLSHNNLSGEIPTGRHLQTLDNPWNYEGNPGLCGAPLLKKCNDNKAWETPSAEFSHSDEEEQKTYRIWFCGVVISGFATGFWGIIGVLMFKRGWRFAYFKFADDIIGRVFGR